MTKKDQFNKKIVDVLEDIIFYVESKEYSTYHTKNSTEDLIEIPFEAFSFFDYHQIKEFIKIFKVLNSEYALNFTLTELILHERVRNFYFLQNKETKYRNSIIIIFLKLENNLLEKLRKVSSAIANNISPQETNIGKIEFRKNIDGTELLKLYINKIDIPLRKNSPFYEIFNMYRDNKGKVFLDRKKMNTWFNSIEQKNGALAKNGLHGIRAIFEIRYLNIRIKPNYISKS